MNELKICADNSNDTDRLACYDRAVAKLTTSAASSAPSAAASPAAEFGVRGSELAKKRASSDLKQITATVIKLTKRPRGELTIALDNGQVWTQNEVTASFALRPGEVVTIESGALGSFFLSSSTGRATKVHRLE